VSAKRARHTLLDLAFAPGGGGEQRRFIIQAADELDRQRQAIGRKTDRKRNGRQAGVTPGSIKRRISGRLCRRGWSQGSRTGEDIDVAERSSNLVLQRVLVRFAARLLC